ncbi:unnamed protein product [Rhizophagus irregularis]|nr:unnamed protein product [Rhizophagus irregularis]CAB4405925.1 unnamed protein product [Rhizophagus irregularis]
MQKLPFVLEPPVERCLHSIATLDKKGLKKVAKTVIHHGVCGAINKIRKILTTSNKVEDENPFLDSPPTEITTADNVVQDGDYKHPDVCYIIELLRYTYDMIDKKYRNGKIRNGIFDVSHMFSCFDDIMDLHFGQSFTTTPYSVI